MTDSYINMNNGSYAANILIDLEKAFDDLNHDISLAKMRKYGVRNLEFAWFLSYLRPIVNRHALCGPAKLNEP